MPIESPQTAAWLLVAAAYGVMSTITLAAFVIDKRKARRGQWRTKERTLFILALCCGWPGAMLGMKLARHKTRKPLFRFGIPAVAVLHGVALGYLAWLSFRG